MSVTDSVAVSAVDPDLAGFVEASTVLRPVPLVPEICLYQADEAIALWERTETATGVQQPPPFWAFAWAGGQALARYVLDHPRLVSGRTVLDLAAGSGLVAVAAARAGAARVVANDIDPLSAAAIERNAAANSAPVEVLLGDLLGGSLDSDVGSPGWGTAVVLAGDVYYSRDMAGLVTGYLRRAHMGGAVVLVGDPGRAYRPVDGFVEVARYDVPVVAALEDAEVKATAVLRMHALQR